MKTNRSNLFGGIVLVGFGILAVVYQMGYLNQLSQQQMLIWSFALAGLLGLVLYMVSGFKDWGWLFPAGVFGGLAVTVAMAVNGVDSAVVGSPLFFGLLIPFAAAYLTDRAKNWWSLIPGGVMLFLAFVTLIVDNTRGEWIGAMFLFMIGLPFLIVYLNNRARNWWALIPAGVMLFLSLIVVMSTSVRGEWISALFLFAIALVFFFVYINNRARQWALLVTYIMFVLSIAPAMASFGGDTAAYYGSIILFAVAVAFFVVYFRSENNWWAIIPAGVMTTLAVLAGAAIAGWINDETSGAYSFAFLMGGLAATFAIVWLKSTKPWAKTVTIVLAIMAVASLFFVSYYEIYWPVVLILGGAYLLFTALRPKSA